MSCCTLFEKHQIRKSDPKDPTFGSTVRPWFGMRVHAGIFTQSFTLLTHQVLDTAMACMRCELLTTVSSVPIRYRAGLQAFFPSLQRWSCTSKVWLYGSFETKQQMGFIPQLQRNQVLLDTSLDTTGCRSQMMDVVRRIPK